MEIKQFDKIKLPPETTTAYMHMKRAKVSTNFFFLHCRDKPCIRQLTSLNDALSREPAVTNELERPKEA
jgi:hypothetical protein